jgi:hypothetical protein
LEDDHVAAAVTFCVVPFDRVAVAASWLVWPTPGTAPVTAREEVDVAAVGLLLPHEDNKVPTATIMVPAIKRTSVPRAPRRRLDRAAVRHSHIGIPLSESRRFDVMALLRNEMQ